MVTFDYKCDIRIVGLRIDAKRMAQEQSRRVNCLVKMISDIDSSKRQNCTRLIALAKCYFVYSAKN